MYSHRGKKRVVSICCAVSQTIEMTVTIVINFIQMRRTDSPPEQCLRLKAVTEMFRLSVAWLVVGPYVRALVTFSILQ